MTDSLIAGRYRVLQRLGAGASGEVYLVEHTQLGRQEALKIVADDRTDPTVAGRFRREVRASQRLAHPGIVAPYDFGQLPDGRWYLTMEAVSGPPLDALLHQRGPLPIALALGIVAEVADALHHAHQHDVVHRDIKPHNLILAPHERGHQVKVLDFGMAKILDPSVQESVMLSRGGVPHGTPQYMAPEQCRSQPPDGRTDLYALGCVLHELLVGEPPFRGKPLDLLVAHLSQPPRPPSQVDPGAGISPELDAVVARCLAKDRTHRFATGADLCAAVQGVPGYRPLRVF
ncbi:MAG: serine/threonine protein kinase [Kofleriaceae bacterium]|nr:serine/threonine protein kinase [Kofleriaceae bacterium]MBP6840663.1 serine/threonine protein kinase [Kofleriaceae bacterium]